MIPEKFETNEKEKRRSTLRVFALKWYLQRTTNPPIPETYYHVSLHTICSSANCFYTFLLSNTTWVRPGIPVSLIESQHHSDAANTSMWKASNTIGPIIIIMVGGWSTWRKTIPHSWNDKNRTSSTFQLNLRQNRWTYSTSWDFLLRDKQRDRRLRVWGENEGLSERFSTIDVQQDLKRYGFWATWWLRGISVQLRVNAHLFMPKTSSCTSNRDPHPGIEATPFDGSKLIKLITWNRSKHEHFIQ